MFGEITGAELLDRGKRVFISSSGKPVSSPPTGNYLQCIGVATSSSSFIFIPSTNIVRRNP